MTMNYTSIFIETDIQSNSLSFTEFPAGILQGQFFSADSKF